MVVSIRRSRFSPKSIRVTTAEEEGSVVQCLTRDRGVAGSSLIGGGGGVLCYIYNQPTHTLQYIVF